MNIYILEKVISGGQTGADRAGLEAAKKLCISTGGTAPPNYSTTNGPDYSLKQLGLKAIPKQSHWAQGYIKRTKMNIDDSDATIVFRTHPGKGTDKTIGYCFTHKWKIIKHPLTSHSWKSSGYRPLLVVFKMNNFSVDAVKMFLRENNVKIVNVAGHREFDGFQNKVYNFLLKAFDPN